jgi:hydrogenase maturation protease
MSRAIVIAIGNEYRGDDGVGPAVIAEIAKDPPAGVELTRCDGEPAGLLEAWAGAELAIVVDAVLCVPAQPGRIWRSTVDNLTGTTTAASSHALGIPEALLLGRALDRVPRELVVIAVEAASLDLGFGLSAPVAAAVPAAAAAVLSELRGRRHANR